MLDNLRVFIAAAEHRSLTRAADQLGMTIATVSRRVSELEQHLGCLVFQRSNKGLTLTPAGKSYYEETAYFIHELDLRLLNLDKSLNSLEGELNVMAPTNIGSGPLEIFWQSFITKYSEISLTILLGDPADDVIPQHVDIAIRSGPQKNSSLIQKLLGSITPILVASPNLNTGLPTKIPDLELYPSIAAQLFGDWRLVRGDEVQLVHKKHKHISNDMNVTLNLVKAGAGIALLPMSMVYQELQKGELMRVMPAWSGIPREIFLLWPDRRSQSVRAKRFREELLDFLQTQSWFNMGS